MDDCICLCKSSWNQYFCLGVRLAVNQIKTVTGNLRNSSRSSTRAIFFPFASRVKLYHRAINSAWDRWTVNCGAQGLVKKIAWDVRVLHQKMKLHLQFVLSRTRKFRPLNGLKTLSIVSSTSARDLKTHPANELLWSKQLTCTTMLVSHVSEWEKVMNWNEFVRRGKASFMTNINRIVCDKTIQVSIKIKGGDVKCFNSKSAFAIQKVLESLLKLSSHQAKQQEDLQSRSSKFFYHELFIKRNVLQHFEYSNFSSLN